eukprot:scaffold72884_cov57-Phaeocystis_antarctica.AAC.1
MTTNPSWQPSVGRQGRTFAFLEGAKLGKSARRPDLAGKDTKFVPGPPGAWGRAPRTHTPRGPRRAIRAARYAGRATRAGVLRTARYRYRWSDPTCETQDRQTERQARTRGSPSV